MKTKFPERIICLTEETTEFIYALGEDERIVGISGFTMRPPSARKTKPKVSTFIDADYELINSLKPDLILAFSDLQADISKELIKQGHTVTTFNQRNISEILRAMLMIGSLLGCEDKAKKLIKKYEDKIEDVRSKSKLIKNKHKVYFEEWYDPLISGICWVSELIEIAGGVDIFSELRNQHAAKNRIVKPKDVIERNPDIIIGSWCGKMFKPEKVLNRKGWDKIEAVKNSRIYEVKSTIILQPGPASLTEGLDAIKEIIDKFS